MMLMNAINVPVQSLKTLLISTVSAALLAFVILVVFIAPAEYAIDPTGLGKVLGLTAMGESVRKGTKKIESCPTGKQLADWQDIVKITIPAHSGLEYQFYLQKDAEISYAWSTDGNALYFDFHGEPKGDKTGYFKSYRIAMASEDDGSQKVPFAGAHGWYWQNNTNRDIQVVLKTKGQYKIKGL